MNALDPSAETRLSLARENIMVLLVDDQVMVAEVMRRALLDQSDLVFHYCQDCANAVEVAKQVRPTVILQDLVMPGVDGLDLVRAYRADRETSKIPIIVLSAKEEATVKSEAFRAGANDYLVKLPEPIELIARIRYHSNAYLAQQQRDEAYRALRRSQQALTEINLELQRLTQIDGLTSLSNRRYLSESFEAEWRHGSRTRLPMSVMMIDIDHFKSFNDTYGHVAGDECLKSVADVLKSSCRRASDVAARFGGEEFLLLFPGMPAADAAALANELVAKVAALDIPHAQSSIESRVTISVGVATQIPERGQPSADLIKAADDALYSAKAAGRNRACAR